MKSANFAFCEQVVLALLLILGTYLPTSTDGEHSRFWVFTSFAALMGLLGYLSWNFGVLPSAVPQITLPILIVLVGCTLIAKVKDHYEFDFGMLVKFSALAAVLSLDLRKLRLGHFGYRAFVVVNCINLALGAGILIGSEWATDFVTKYYWSFTPGLVQWMSSLHKPVLSFGSHSVAALFLYLFFWANWKDYELHRRRPSSLLALGHLVLLLGLTSFASLGLGALALVQVCIWLWRKQRRQIIIVGSCLVGLLILALRIAADETNQIADLPQFAPAVFLNNDVSGPLARYGRDGELRMAINYVYNHPLSPIGLTAGPSAPMEVVWTPFHFFIGDSGPLEYLLRGSVPLFFLIYFGLYGFLRRNLVLRSHAWSLFLAILLFESGFSVLSYSRMYYLLPFFVVYLNGVASGSAVQSAQGTIPARFGPKRLAHLGSPNSA